MMSLDHPDDSGRAVRGADRPIESPADTPRTAAVSSTVAVGLARMEPCPLEAIVTGQLSGGSQAALRRRGRYRIVGSSFRFPSCSLITSWTPSDRATSDWLYAGPLTDSPGSSRAKIPANGCDSHRLWIWHRTHRSRLPQPSVNG